MARAEKKVPARFKFSFTPGLRRIVVEDKLLRTKQILTDADIDAYMQAFEMYNNSTLQPDEGEVDASEVSMV